jgi:hypothetical protein
MSQLFARMLTRKVSQSAIDLLSPKVETVFLFPASPEKAIQAADRFLGNPANILTIKVASDQLFGLPTAQHPDDMI